MLYLLLTAHSQLR
jgi:hypothetical protein